MNFRDLLRAMLYDWGYAVASWGPRTISVPSRTRSYLYFIIEGSNVRVVGEGTTDIEPIATVDLVEPDSVEELEQILQTHALPPHI